jgi:hypothetical protein
MKLEQIFEAIDLAELNRYIAEQQEEHLHLEFKTVNHPYDIVYDEKKGKASYTKDDAKNADKKNISKTLSGFANSNGGIVIWGIKTEENKLKPDVAEKLVPIRELTKFLTLLNRLESESVTPPIAGVVHKKIDLGNDTGYVKTYVPASESAPHMANYADKHYYKRSGGNFYQCEHYDIIDIFSRKKYPKIELLFRIEQVYKRSDSLVNGQAYNLERYLVVWAKNAGNLYVKYLNCFLTLNEAVLHPATYQDKIRLDGGNSNFYYRFLVENKLDKAFQPILPEAEYPLTRILLNRDVKMTDDNRLVHYQLHADNAPVVKHFADLQTLEEKLAKLPNSFS